MEHGKVEIAGEILLGVGREFGRVLNGCWQAKARLHVMRSEKGGAVPSRPSVAGRPLFCQLAEAFDAFAFNVWDFATEGGQERALSMPTYQRLCNPKYAMSEYGNQEDVRRLRPPCLFAAKRRTDHQRKV